MAGVLPTHHRGRCCATLQIRSPAVCPPQESARDGLQIKQGPVFRQGPSLFDAAVPLLAWGPHYHRRCGVSLLKSSAWGRWDHRAEHR
ncbi:hypothetical protein KCP76_03100 [Salmonella enterica subsp. enterica serovar Weltevreden]|nr:hypothetical protein KCP76_03100 [Salmonella enterica subsp. enterica serovar Weltevreden]